MQFSSCDYTNSSNVVFVKSRRIYWQLTCVVESLRVESNGCVGVLLTFGEPTGLELPEVEVPGSGRLLPIVGEIAGGVTEDMTIVGGFTDTSRVEHLVSMTFVSTDKVGRVDTEVLTDVFKSVVVLTAAVLLSTIKDIGVVTVAFALVMRRPSDWVFVSVLLDLSMEFL